MQKQSARDTKILGEKKNEKLKWHWDIYIIDKQQEQCARYKYINQNECVLEAANMHGAAKCSEIVDSAPIATQTNVQWHSDMHAKQQQHSPMQTFNQFQKKAAL